MMPSLFSPSTDSTMDYIQQSGEAIIQSPDSRWAAVQTSLDEILAFMIHLDHRLEYLAPLTPKSFIATKEFQWPHMVNPAASPPAIGGINEIPSA
ncbi:hypothetical protein O6P43_020962 [Quillaja saponaria]|uniref:Uncharacterized protein n=1 Tax=Quillaja saponaria TaxID=32244 RepID=A0AAD7LPD3_QUISA|nr:hypothetical protein O6P43_020962 [Quillaja saponaria]